MELVGKEVWSVIASEWGVADINAIFTTREKGVDYLHKEAKRCNWEILKEENEKGYTYIEVKVVCFTLEYKKKQYIKNGARET